MHRVASYSIPTGAFGWKRIPSAACAAGTANAAASGTHLETTFHPRIPSLKQVLGAAKKPKKEIKIADLGSTPDQLQPREVHRSVKGFVAHRKHIAFKEANTAANVAKLVSSLGAEGLQ